MHATHQSGVRLIGSRLVAVSLGALAPFAAIEVFGWVTDATTRFVVRGVTLDLVGGYRAVLFVLTACAIARFIQIAHRDWINFKHRAQALRQLP